MCNKMLWKFILQTVPDFWLCAEEQSFSKHSVINIALCNSTTVTTSGNQLINLTVISTTYYSF